MCIKIMVLNKLYYGMIVVDMFRLVRSKNMSKFWLKICLFKINFIMSDLIRYLSVFMVKNREFFFREVWEMSKMFGNVGLIILFVYFCNRMFDEWNGYSKIYF